MTIAGAVAATECSTDHVNSSLIDQEVDYFANNSSVSMEQKQIFASLKTGLLSIQQSEPPEMSLKSPILLSSPRLESVAKHKKLTILEIEDQELDLIENQRHQKRIQDLKTWPQAMILHTNPVELVNQISDRVVHQIVDQVCHEAVDEEELIQKLIQAELLLDQ